MNSDEISESNGLMSCSTTASSFAVSLTPPSLEECIFQPQLYVGFMKYLVQLKASENLLFIKHATLFAMVNLSPRDKYVMASKIIWSFISDSSPTPVNVSAETRNKLSRVIWRTDGFSLVNNELFDEAVNEIKFLVTPMFNKWLETNEWQHVPFFHAPPPTVPIILRLPSLRSCFESFLDDRRKEPKPHVQAEMDYKSFQMCTKVHDILEQMKAPGLSSKDADRKARHFIKAQKAEILSISSIKDLEMPMLQRKKKHADNSDEESKSGDAEGELEAVSCNDYLADILDTLSEELMDHECYEHFVEERSWKCADVVKVSLQQTTDKEGYAVDPTLSGILHSPTYGPLILESLKGTEKHSQLVFLLEAQDFYTRYSAKRKFTPQDRKEMQADARRIYETHFLKSDMELPKRVKSELMKVVHSPTGRLNPLLFQTAGAWIFNKIERSWIREANSLKLWADHDYDNNSHAAQEMDKIFNLSVITSNSVLASENLGLVPHPDDVLGSPVLFDSFHKFVPATDFNNACFEFLHLTEELEGVHPESKAAKCEKLLELLKSISKEYADFSPLKEELEEHYLEDPQSFNILAFRTPAFYVAKLLMVRHYSSWLSKCKAVYKSGGWQPVRSLTFVGGNAIPGTTWIPTLGTADEAGNTSVPAKRRWGLRSKRRSSSGETSPVIVSMNKSASLQPPSPVTRVVVTTPKEDMLLGKPTRDSAASDDDSDISYNKNIDTARSPSPLPPQQHLPTVVPTSVPDIHMEIPTMLDTLTCTHLRRLFYSTFLDYRLGDGEKKLWTALCKFHSDFSSLTDEEISNRQNDIRDSAMKVLDENPQIPDHDDLVKVIKQSSYNISSRFFFDAEVKLYGGFHNNYESFLAKNQWVRY